MASHAIDATCKKEILRTDVSLHLHLQPYHGKVISTLPLAALIQGACIKRGERRDQCVGFAYEVHPLGKTQTPAIKRDEGALVQRSHSVISPLVG